MRIVLFDIDGTLLTTAGSAREAFARALCEAAGRSIGLNGYSFSGRTDPQIARDILLGNGLEGEALESAIPAAIRLYLRHFGEGLPGMQGARLLPGVRQILAALAARSDARTALLTGNVEAGARLKLGHFGIAGFFDFALSCFGSDDADRYRLPALALERARRAFGGGIAGADLVIVGDSEHDVLCGRSIGARSVAVGTGWTPAERLRSLGPDVFLDDLSDTGRAIAGLLDGPGAGAISAGRPGGKTGGG
jgi:phosphoglycolate phosphatase-like HAD superfamily hydrolase